MINELSIPSLIIPPGDVTNGWMNAFKCIIVRTYQMIVVNTLYLLGAHTSVCTTRYNTSCCRFATRWKCATIAALQLLQLLQRRCAYECVFQLHTLHRSIYTHCIVLFTSRLTFTKIRITRLFIFLHAHNGQRIHICIHRMMYYICPGCGNYRQRSLLLHRST